MSATEHGSDGTGPDRRLRVIAGAHEESARIVRLLDDATIRVELPPGEVPWRQQVLAIAIVDLLGRLFPKIELSCDGQSLAHIELPPGGESLLNRLEEAARRGGLPALEPAEASVTIRIGPGNPNEPVAGRMLHVDGGGWISYNGTKPSELPSGEWPQVPVGPLAAACRTAAQVTHLVLGSLDLPSIEPSVYASALTHTTSNEPFLETDITDSGAILDAVLVGAGSIGGAAVYTLAHTPGLAGSLVVADPQTLEPRNLDRALLATTSDTALSRPKVEVAHDALAHQPALAMTPWQGSVEDWVASRPRTQTLPLVLAAVDSHNSRRSIQDCLPYELVNAACNPTEVHVSGHRTDDGPCVCCLHMEDVLDGSAVRARLLSAATGMNERAVAAHLEGEIPMPEAMLRQIERHRSLPIGHLARYVGKTLEELRRGELIYGETAVETDTATVAVAAPYITALAGVLLAGEALKATRPELTRYRLGPSGAHTKYAENPVVGPASAMLTNPPRWAGSECLCRSTRRLRILRQRYGLSNGTDDTGSDK